MYQSSDSIFLGDGFQAVSMRFQSYRLCLIYSTLSYQRHKRVNILGLVLCEDAQREWSSVSAWHSYWWFLLGSHVCLVDVFRFHVPHSSVGKRTFSMFTALTICCIRAGSLWECSGRVEFRKSLITSGSNIPKQIQLGRSREVLETGRARAYARAVPLVYYISIIGK